MRLVLDTNVIVAALRSAKGASAALLEKAFQGAFQPVLSVPLVFEYEAICCLPEHRLVSGLTEDEVLSVINALCQIAYKSETQFLWRPQLRDAADEMVLEAVVNSNADALVTHNEKDFKGAIDKFGIELLSPQNALRRILT